MGGNDLWHAGVRWAIVPVGLFGIAKAALPTWLGLGPLYRGYATAMMAGLCAVIGRAWSNFLGFTGGRALSTVWPLSGRRK
jgi:glycerol-3-phosphate acyltransferase PlsY